MTMSWHWLRRNLHCLARFSCAVTLGDEQMRFRLTAASILAFLLAGGAAAQ